ncbi:DUF6636 domain-containing protein [Mycobacterium sp. 1274756.6]|uniref:DUF6636 domain-containing protein n=1 Tax=Mycobacterium sp. 1274756.6 TaxID=1834076 RepID=UPI0007FC66F4|nr:DUF6636 domain-containing protein [Mycobacterium sp. 1274756.6]OBJ73072.1 hypothetical protein A5643_04565 [Mycobacterium sp. 1274756.6]
MRSARVLVTGVCGAVVGVLGAVPAQAGPYSTDFTSPSGNIDCAIWESGHDIAPHVRCDLNERTFTAPPRPADCGMGPWAKSVTLERGKPAAFRCISDSVLSDDAVVLEYGEEISAEGFRCASSTDGITCTDTTTGNGFRLARDSYAFF